MTGPPIHLLLADELIACGLLEDRQLAVEVGRRLSERYAYAVAEDVARQRDALLAEVGRLNTWLERRRLEDDTDPSPAPPVHNVNGARLHTRNFFLDAS